MRPERKHFTIFSSLERYRINWMEIFEMLWSKAWKICKHLMQYFMWSVLGICYLSFAWKLSNIWAISERYANALIKCATNKVYFEIDLYGKRCNTVCILLYLERTTFNDKKLNGWLDLVEETLLSTVTWRVQIFYTILGYASLLVLILNIICYMIPL